jgi:hypothetical protein
MVRSVYGVRARSAVVRIGILATLRRRSPWNDRTWPTLAVTESIRKCRGPLRTTTVSPSSLARSPASKAFHHAAGQRLSPSVFQTVALASGGAPFSSMISQ